MSSELVELRRAEVLHECPKCGKRALAQVNQECFKCLWCHFRRDLSEPTWGGGGVLAALAAAGLVVLLIF